MMSNMEHLYTVASSLQDDGYSLFPISTTNKKPLRTWKEFQERRATDDEFDNWFTHGAPCKEDEEGEVRLVIPFNLAIATGAISNLVVVDCDNEAAEDWWKENGQWTPVTVKTKRGRHFWYAHPNQNVKNGASVFGIKGLDVRGDGGYVVAPGSSNDDYVYAFDIDLGYELDDMPVLENMKRPNQEDEEALVDLSHVKAEGAGVLDEAEGHLLERGKYADGDGRNNIITKYIGELINQGHTDETLERNCHRFMDRFFQEPLSVGELQTTMKSIRSADRHNNAENYTSDGERVYVHSEEDDRPKRVKFAGVFTPEEIINLELPENDFLIEPFLIRQSIVQVYGFAGHGKSLVTCAALYNLARGTDFGPYRVKEAKKVLYLDYDMGMRDQFKRMTDFKTLFGDTGDNFILISRAAMAKESISVDFRSDEGWNNLVDMIDHFDPDVVCLDNLRTICDGMQEAQSHEWSMVNKRLMQIRDELQKTVIYLHHSNKPQRDSSGTVHSGTSAGSSNQVTPLEVQLRIAKVDDETDENYAAIEQKLRDQHGDLSFIRHLAEVSYGKVRDFDPELHKTEYVGFCRTDGDGRALVSSTSNRQKMVNMLRMGQSMSHIAQTLKVGVSTMEIWKEEMGIH